MDTIFNLKQSASALPSLNQGLSKSTYEQISPTRDVTGDNFPKGSMFFRFERSGVGWWMSPRTYLRLRGRIVKGDGVTQVVIADDVAPNMGLMACLFQSAEFRIGDKVISRVSDYMAQVDALEKRLVKSKSWMSNAGKDLERWDPSFKQRQNDICSDGYNADEKTQHVLSTAVDAVAVVGFTAAVTVQIIALTSRIVFALGNANINNVTVLHVGDVFILLGVRYLITKILTDLTAEVTALNIATILNVAAVAIGASTVERVQDQDTNKSSNRSGIELIWQPPLSVFKINHALPTGKYVLVLTPQTSDVYQKRAIESLLGDQNAPADFQFIVDDFYLHVATVEGPRADNLSYFMSLDETRCQAEQVDNNNSLQQKNFDVSPSTYALSVAYQSQNIQDTRNSPSKFKFPSPNATVPSGELLLKRFFIQYNGENKPVPDADVNYISAKGFINTRFAESLIYSGAYFDSGGSESREDWLARGLYMYYSYPKDGTSESTRVVVKSQFAVAPGANVANVLLFDHHKKMILVSIVDGRVVDVVEQDG